MSQRLARISVSDIKLVSPSHSTRSIDAGSSVLCILAVDINNHYAGPSIG
jgi:hypothetical protein